MENFDVNSEKCWKTQELPGDSEILELFLILLKRIEYILSQSIRLITGTNKKGRIMLRYLTIAPKKFTVKPINSRNEKEKKMQNQINAADFTPFVRQNRNNKNQNYRFHYIAFFIAFKLRKPASQFI